MGSVVFAAVLGMSAFRFVQLDPGHFHAALVQKRAYPFAEVSPDGRVRVLGFDGAPTREW